MSIDQQRPREGASNNNDLLTTIATRGQHLKDLYKIVVKQQGVSYY